MGFSAYILESLKRYGKAEVGPLGTFVLDYQPAHWNISKQYFTPPISKLSWIATSNPVSKSDLLISSVSRMHEISQKHSSEFINESISKIQSELNEKNQFDLGVLGSLTVENTDGVIQFKPNPEFNHYLEYSQLSLPALQPQEATDEAPNWMIWILLLLSVIGFVYIISGINKTKVEVSSSFQSTTSEAQEMKGLNLAPTFSDSINLTEDSTQGNIIPEQRIIITGTFCKPGNIRKMREKIEYLEYRVYEEFIDDDCVRLGIFLNANDDLESSLDDIRKYIEPHAWVLN